MNLIYRIYHSLPGAQRIRFMQGLQRMARKNLIFKLFWNKVVMRYHFLHGIRAGFTLELTDKCNLKCTYCPKSLDIGVKGSHMKWETLVKSVDGAMEERKVSIFNLVGFGEPFLYPNLEDAIRYIKSKNPAAEVRITSNGTLLSAEVGRKMAAAGLSQITISVNASSYAQYQRINASDKYNKVVENTIGFLNAVNEADCGMLVIIQVLSVVNDSDQIDDFYKFWNPHLGKSGVIQVQPFVNWAGQIDTQTILDREEEARKTKVIDDKVISSGKLLKALKERKQEKEDPFAYDEASKEKEVEPYPCYHVHRTRIISREGNALACCMVFPEEQGDLALGNVENKSVKELYLSGKAQELRKADMNGKLGEYKPCDTCNAWKTVPNIWIKNPLHRLVGPKWF